MLHEELRIGTRVRLRHQTENTYVDAVLADTGIAFDEQSYDFVWRISGDEIGIVSAVDMPGFEVMNSGGVKVHYRVSAGGKRSLARYPVQSMFSNVTAEKLKGRFDQYEKFLKEACL
jgi:hypothetical protein